MIYTRVDAEVPIRQGDIFRGIPRIDCSLGRLAILDEDDSHREVSWSEILRENAYDTVTALLPLKPVQAIVITQNCDAVRGEYLCLCEIDEFLSATGKKDKPPSNSKKWE